MNVPTAPAPDPQPRAWLLVCAAPAEARAVGRAFDASRFSVDGAAAIRWKPIEAAPGIDLLVSGVGKANASGALARAFDPARHAVVLNLGVAGALPRSRLSLLDVVVAEPSVYADEGVRTPQRFIDIARCGFAPNQGLGAPSVSARADAALLERLVSALTARSGPIATVSTCSGRNGLALRVVRETGAIAEAMEGAALAFTLRRLSHESGASASFAEVRVISNTTGNRARQRWDLPGALARLTEIARLAAALR